MHHLIGTGLHCAPLTCIVHHRPALCNMVHKGDLCPSDVGVAPDIFHFLMGHKEHAKNGHFLSIFDGAQEHTMNTLAGVGLPIWCTVHIFFIG